MFTRLNQQLQGRWECESKGSVYFFMFKPTAEPTLSNASRSAFSSGTGGYFSTNALTEVRGDYILLESSPGQRHTLKTQDEYVNSVQLSEFELISPTEMLFYIDGYSYNFTKKNS